MLDRLTVGPSSAQEDKSTDTKPLLCRISSSLYSQLGFRLQYSPHTGDHILTNVEHDSPAERVGIRDGHRLLQVNMTRTLGLSSMFPVFIILFNKNVFILLTFVKKPTTKGRRHIASQQYRRAPISRCPCRQCQDCQHVCVGVNYNQRCCVALVCAANVQINRSLSKNTYSFIHCVFSCLM